MDAQNSETQDVLAKRAALCEELTALQKKYGAGFTLVGIDFTEVGRIFAKQFGGMPDGCEYQVMILHKSEACIVEMMRQVQAPLVAMVAKANEPSTN